jgi:hypothetical protein
LILQEREQPLDGHKDQGQKEKVQKEEIEADVALRLDGAGYFDARTSGQRRQQGEWRRAPYCGGGSGW